MGQRVTARLAYDGAVRPKILLAGIALLAGCQPSGGTTAPKPVSRFGLLSPGDQRSAEMGTLVIPKEALAYHLPGYGGQQLGIVNSTIQVQNLYCQWGYLRNPGGGICIFPGDGNPPLNASERKAVEALAQNQGLRRVTNLRTLIRFGPDGRTPLVMRGAGVVSDTRDPLVPLQVFLAFPTAKQAREASRYIDRKGYQVLVDGPHLTAVCKIPRSQAILESRGFDGLAARFGGKVDSYQTTEKE